MPAQSGQEHDILISFGAGNSPSDALHDVLRKPALQEFDDGADRAGAVRADRLPARRRRDRDVDLDPKGELYVFAESRDRLAKERSMRRRQLKWLWKRLKELSAMTLSRQELLMKLGAARERAHTAWRLIIIDVDEKAPTFRYRLDRDKLRQVRRREGRYLLRTNLADDDPARLWSYYLQLVHIEEAFRNLKGDLAVRPIFHQLESRVEAHIFIAFLAYCLHVTLARRLGAFAPGLTPRSVLEKFSAVQMIDVHIPTTDGREIQLTRHTEPQAELKLLLDKLKLQLPPQPSPRITSVQAAPPTPL
jgi:hypothetical protein